MAMVFINFCLALFLTANFANGIGVNWGSTTSHNLPPRIVAEMLQDNGIGSVKLFGSDASMINAFAKRNIDVMVGIPNNDLKKFSESYDNAKNWVEHSIVKHVNVGVSITYVAVGNEPFLQSYNGLYLNNTFPAVKNIQKALNKAGLGDQIKVTTPLNEDIYDLRPIAPSECHFRKDINDIVVEMLRWFDTNKSPFLVNLNPFRSYQDLKYSYDSVFFATDAKPIVTDKNMSYNNVFDLSIDKLASSLSSVGVPNLKIMVGEIGWPTDGGFNANNTLAQKFYSNFFKKLGSNEGTPLCPGPMGIYLSSLLDEDMRSIAQGNHERHWGIFRFNGKPKYPIDFSLKGKDVMPVGVKEIVIADSIYCVFNDDTKTNLSAVPAIIDYICKAADCTALTYGSSCNNLDFAGNLTYMFNMYFQMYSHIEDSCNFYGMATLTLMNPSTSTCFFPIQLKSVGEMRVFGACEIVVGILAMLLLALFQGGV